MQIVWDEPKRIKNLRKHLLDFADLDPTYFDRSVVTAARDGRFKATTNWQGHDMTVAFRPLGREAISVISMRPASFAERKRIWRG
ncbi:MAG: BrnT family toxin [Aliihoeflea sp.]|uniref:BrnT family toxin n=1 Tax=Aliihoeflea sp. TaxID=2608088 RepID=UPI0040337F4E